MKKLIRVIVAVIALLSLTTSVAFMNMPAERQPNNQKITQQQKKQQQKKNQQKKKVVQSKAPATDMFASLRDDANRLSANDRAQILATLKAIEEKHKIRCAVVYTTNLGGMEIGKYANSLIDKYYNDGERGNIVLVINPQSRKYYFSTDNKMRKIILDGDKHGVGYLKKAFVPALKKNKWAKAANDYAKCVDELNTYFEKEGKAYDPADEFNFIAAAIAAVLAAIAAYCVRKYLIGTMSNVAPAKTAKEYLVKDSININQSNDVYLYTTTTVTHRESSSSNDSTDSSHGGGGGSF